MLAALETFYDILCAEEKELQRKIEAIRKVKAFYEPTVNPPAKVVFGRRVSAIAPATILEESMPVRELVRKTPVETSFAAPVEEPATMSIMETAEQVAAPAEQHEPEQASDTERPEESESEPERSEAPDKPAEGASVKRTRKREFIEEFILSLDRKKEYEKKDVRYRVGCSSVTLLKIIKDLKDRNIVIIAEGRSSHYIKFVNADDPSTPAPAAIFKQEPEQTGEITDDIIEERLEILQQKGYIVYPMYSVKKQLLKGFTVEADKVTIKLAWGYGLNQETDVRTLDKDDIIKFLKQMEYLKLW